MRARIADMSTGARVGYAISALVFVALIGLAFLYFFGQAVGPAERIELTVDEVERNEAVNPSSGGTRTSYELTSTDGEEFEIDSDQYQDLREGSTYNCEAKGYGLLVLRRSLSSCETVSEGSAMPGVPEDAAPEPPATQPSPAARCIDDELAGRGEHRYSSVYLAEASSTCLPPASTIRFDLCVARSARVGARTIEDCVRKALRSE